jgi:hypothetical protein
LPTKPLDPKVGPRIEKVPVEDWKVALFSASELLLDDKQTESKPEHDSLETAEDLDAQVAYLASCTTCTAMVNILKENSLGTQGTKAEQVKRLLVFILGE